MTGGACPPSLISGDILGQLCETARQVPAGAFVEVGVYQGGSAWHLARVARAQGRQLWLFDTFTGIPMQGVLDRHEVGDFGDCAAWAVREAIPDALLVVGKFPETLDLAVFSGLGTVAFAHLDCDQYESVKMTALALAGHMAQGGCMVFDDYTHLPGARAAVDEVFGERVVKGVGGQVQVWF